MSVPQIISGIINAYQVVNQLSSYMTEMKISGYNNENECYINFSSRNEQYKIFISNDKKVIGRLFITFNDRNFHMDELIRVFKEICYDYDKLECNIRYETRKYQMPTVYHMHGTGRVSFKYENYYVFE